MIKIKRLITSLFLFFVILIVIYITHINFFYVNVIFYSAILDAILAAITTTLLLKYNKYFKIFSFFEKVLIFIICLLLGYSLAVSIPTIIDRSLSFYILEKIQEKGSSIKERKFEELFTREYMIEHQLVKVRLTEQLESGTIVIENGCVKLTKLGETLASMSRNFRKHFLAKKRLLSGKYTNELTKISKFNSRDIKNKELYKCNKDNF
jgi:hypothetical protein